MLKHMSDMSVVMLKGEDVDQYRKKTEFWAIRLSSPADSGHMRLRLSCVDRYLGIPGQWGYFHYSDIDYEPIVLDWKARICVHTPYPKDRWYYSKGSAFRTEEEAKQALQNYNDDLVLFELSRLGQN